MKRKREKKKKDEKRKRFNKISKLFRLRLRIAVKQKLMMFSEDAEQGEDTARRLGGRTRAHYEETADDEQDAAAL